MTNTTPTTGRTWSLNSYNNGKFYIADETSFINRFMIDESGNIGIGSENPGAKLEITVPNNLGNTPLLYFSTGDIGSGDIAGFSYNSDWPHPLILNTQVNNDYARPFAIMSGSVGIGTIEPTSKLQVVGLP